MTDSSSRSSANSAKNSTLFSEIPAFLCVIKPKETLYILAFM
jgi:hypothetical protein